MDHTLVARFADLTKDLDLILSQVQPLALCPQVVMRMVLVSVSQG